MVMRINNSNRIFHKAKSYKSDGNNMVKRKSDGAVRSYNERRFKLTGFPLAEKFKSTAEVIEYLSGDEIQCLLCGRSFKALPKHLVSIHRIDSDTYREMYDIPWTVGLVCSESSENYKLSIHRRINCGDLDMVEMARLRKSFKKRQRPLTPYIKAASIERGRAGIIKYNKEKAVFA